MDLLERFVRVQQEQSRDGDARANALADDGDDRFHIS